MATAEDILRKSRKKKETTFQVVQRRAWDYLDSSKNSDCHISPYETNNSTTEQNPIAPVNINIEKTLVHVIKESDSDINNNLKTDIHDSYRESIDSPTKETIQKKLITLTGHQKQIIRLVISHIKSRGGSPCTVSIYPNILSAKIKASIEVTRVSLKRLIEKNLLVRMKGEKGRNGCCKFKMREDVIKTCFTLFNDAPCDINVIENR